MTEEDIIPTTLENIFMIGALNDFGFRVNDRLMVLTEAQSDWSVNILIRMFFYIADTYSNYYKEQGLSFHSTHKLVFPRPELYVIYTDGDIIKQYINFTKVYDEQRRLHGRTRKAVIETIDICKDKNLLREYLTKHEKEAVSIMMAINDVQYNLTAYANEIRADSKAEAKEENTLENIKSIMKNLGVTPDKAMEVLDVSPSEYDKYRKLIG